MILINPGHIASLSVPDHKELAKGTLRALIRSAGMTPDRFIELLGWVWGGRTSALPVARTFDEDQRDRQIRERGTGRSG